MGGRAAKKSQDRALLGREDVVIDWLQGGAGRKDRTKGLMKHSAKRYRNHRMPGGEGQGVAGQHT